MSGQFKWKCVRQCLPGHPLQNFLEINQPKMHHQFPNKTKTWFIIPGTWWICVYPGWRNLLLCLRDLRVNFVPLSMNGTKHQQLSLNINVFVFCPTLWHKDIGVVIMKLQLLHGNNKMLTGGQKWRKQITTSIILKILQPICVDKWIRMMKLLEDWEVLIYTA